MRNLSNNIVDLWRKFCWRAIYLGPRRDITIDSSNGLLTVDSKDWLIGKYLYVRRQHETGEMEQVAKLLNKEGYLGSGSPPSTVLNVGANIGMTAIGLLRNGFFKRAVAFEPTPNSFRLLGLNIQQNGLSDRIQSFPIALSAANGEFDLELSRDNSGDNRISVTRKPGFFDEQKRRTVRVTAKTLDSFLEENSGLRAEPVRLAWVDIQGHEGHFFRGARQFFRRGIPAVSEIWPYGIDRSGMSAQEFCSTVSELFSHFYVLGILPEQKCPISEFESLFRKYSGPREVCVVLLLPKGPANSASS